MPDQERDDAAPKRLIYEMREEVQAARNQYHDEGAYGDISSETHLELAAKAIQYYDVLYEFHDEPILDEEDFPDIAPIRDRIGEKAARMRGGGGRSGGVTTEQVPAVTEVPISQIIQITKDLDAVAKKLSFAATAADSTPRTEINDELVEEVEQWRQKNLE